MLIDHNSTTYSDLESLVLGLVSAPHELEWLEFKHNQGDPEEIGKYVSALSNAAALHGRSRGFLVWGIEDETHAILGTTFNPHTKKRGGELLEGWLAHKVTPRMDLGFHTGTVRGERVVVLEIPAAMHTPTRFSGVEYVRVGSSTRKLADHPEKARKLWFRLTRTGFEDGIARRGLSAGDVLSLLDIPAYFDLSDQPVPSTPEKIVERLGEEAFVTSEPDGTFSITNLGAITFGKSLRRLGLERKAVRVIAYAGTSRNHGLRERQEAGGYIAGFQRLMDAIMAQLPSGETIGQTLREAHALYPEAAVRELVANALIHQDFSLTGTGPMVEIFDGRIEITNPGTPLVDPMRLLDSPARSRNEALAAMMRRFNYAEERGSGIDRVVTLVEADRSPAPDFQVTAEHFTAILYAPRPVTEMNKDDRIRATYQHACLQWVARAQLTNSTLRQRFGISEGNSAIASRIIGETETAGFIKKFNPESWSRKHARYVPFWA